MTNMEIFNIKAGGVCS